MKYLFSEMAGQLLSSLTYTETLYAFDYDGTLAPIKSTPNKALPSKQTVALLRTLVRSAPTAIISGRSVKDLRTRFDFSPGRLIGNHGAEGLGTAKAAIVKAKRDCASWKRQLLATWKEEIKDHQVLLEDKTYSLTLHFRNSKKKKKTLPELLKRAAELEPHPRILRGKSVINLLSEGTPHKGLVLLELMKINHSKRALYIGDDETDEDVFSMHDPRIITVRVGKKKNSHAQYYVKSQSEVNRVLRRISNSLKAHEKN
jgi:trehalose 6-phosphate phosphatase